MIKTCKNCKNWKPICVLTDGICNSCKMNDIMLALELQRIDKIGIIETHSKYIRQNPDKIYYYLAELLYINNLSP